MNSGPYQVPLPRVQWKIVKPIASSPLSPEEPAGLQAAIDPMGPSTSYICQPLTIYSTYWVNTEGHFIYFFLQPLFYFFFLSKPIQIEFSVTKYVKIEN